MYIINNALISNIRKGITQGVLRKKEVDKICGDSGAYYAGEDMISCKHIKGHFVLMNTKTGKWRLFASNKRLLVSDEDINFEAIKKGCPHCKQPNKKIRYAYLRLHEWFHKGLAPLRWNVYHEESNCISMDMYGHRLDNSYNEFAYCIIDEDLNIIVPFQPMDDVKKVIQRERRKIRARQRRQKK